MAAEDDDLSMWSILDGGNTAWGGKWWALDLTAPSKTPSGAVDSWLTDEEETDTEAPEYLYMELDPAANIARARLVTTHLPLFTEDVAAKSRAAFARQQRGETSGDTSDLYFYEATTDVGPAVAEALSRLRADPDQRISTETPVQAAITATVLNTLFKWRQAPFLAGDKHVIPIEDRFTKTDDYVRRLFEVDEGFHGAEL